MKQTGQDSYDKLKRTAEEYAISKGLNIQTISVYDDPYNIVVDPVIGNNLTSETHSQGYTEIHLDEDDIRKH